MYEGCYLEEKKIWIKFFKVNFEINSTILHGIFWDVREILAANANIMTVIFRHRSKWVRPLKILNHYSRRDFPPPPSPNISKQGPSSHPPSPPTVPIWARPDRYVVGLDRGLFDSIPTRRFKSLKTHLCEEPTDMININN